MLVRQVPIWPILEWLPSVCPCSSSKTLIRVEIAQSMVQTQSWWHHRTIDWHQWNFTMATMNRVVILQQPLKLLCLTMAIGRTCLKTKEPLTKITNFQPYSIAHKASIKLLSKKWSSKMVIVASLSSRLWISQVALFRLRLKMGQPVRLTPRNGLWLMMKAKKIRLYTLS